jgi:hypothetical protein
MEKCPMDGISFEQGLKRFFHHQNKGDDFAVETICKKF